MIQIQLTHPREIQYFEFKRSKMCYFYSKLVGIIGMTRCKLHSIAAIPGSV